MKNMLNIVSSDPDISVLNNPTECLSVHADSMISMVLEWLVMYNNARTDRCVVEDE